MEYYQQAIENNKKIQNNRGERKKKQLSAQKAEGRGGRELVDKGRKGGVWFAQEKWKWNESLEYLKRKFGLRAVDRQRCGGRPAAPRRWWAQQHLLFFTLHRSFIHSPGSGCLFVFTLILFIRLSQSLSALFFHSSLCHSFNISPHLF